MNTKKIATVTYRQIDLMKHTIGFRGDRVKGRIYRTYTPYRNFFDAGEADLLDMRKLCDIGLMQEFRNRLFMVTDDGREFLRWVLDVTILPESE